MLDRKRLDELISLLDETVYAIDTGNGISMKLCIRQSIKDSIKNTLIDLKRLRNN